MSRSTTLATLTASLLMIAGSAAAQPFDHLQCFKIKDSAAKAVYTADLDSADPAFDNVPPGCTIRVPAKFLCVDVAKNNVSPAPPGADDGVSLQKFLCYKTKCAKSSPTATVEDQFGSRSVEVRSTGLVCAPVAPVCVDVDEDDSCDGDDCDDGNASIYPGATEVCNGVDDNCDLSIDESDPMLGGVCVTGSPGVCSLGTNACVSGSLQCVPSQSPSAETCDGQDNNCDGSIDEGGVCLLPAGSTCSMGPQCISSSCVDGVCCNSSCASTCQRCNLPGSLGTCSVIPAGTDPDNECAGASVCNGMLSCTP